MQTHVESDVTIAVLDKGQAALAQELMQLTPANALFPEYRRIYQGVLLKNLGPEHLTACVAALQTKPMRRYFAAAKAMEPELVRQMNELGHRMGQTTLG